MATKEGTEKKIIVDEELTNYSTIAVQKINTKQLFKKSRQWCPHFPTHTGLSLSHQKLNTSPLLFPPRTPLPIQPLAGHRRVKEASVRCQPPALDHIAALLCDHDRGGVRVTRGHLRHDTGVDHAKTINSVDL